MKFMMMSTNGPNEPLSPPTSEMYAEMGKMIEEMSKAGVLLATGGLSSIPIRVKSAAGKFTVVDGPYTEAKEGIVGFALIEAKSKEEALEFSKRFWKVAGDGQGNIYEVFGG
jgi:hypothetical protein